MSKSPEIKKQKFRKRYFFNVSEGIEKPVKKGHGEGR